MMPVHHCSYHNSCQQQRLARPATTPHTSPPPAHHCTKAIQSSANPVSTFRLTVLGLNRSPLHPNKLNELQLLFNEVAQPCSCNQPSSVKQLLSRASKTERPLSMTAAFHMGRCRTDILSYQSMTSGLDVLQYVHRSNRFTEHAWVQG